MQNLILGFAFVLIIILIKIGCKYVNDTNELLKLPRANLSDIQFKTGDVLLFQNRDCSLRWISHHVLYSFVFGTPITHIGVVIVVDGVPHIYECGMNRKNPQFDLLTGTYQTDIKENSLTPLKENIEKYNGYVYHHPLKKSISTADLNDDMFNYMKSMNNIKIKTSMRRIISVLFKIGSCDYDNDNETNCIETCTQILKYMGIIDMNECTYKYDFCDIKKMLVNKYSKPQQLLGKVVQNGI